MIDIHKRKALEAAGFRSGTVAELLGLSEAESRMVELNPAMKMELHDEFRLTPEVRAALGSLLDKSFPTWGFSESRLYFKQLPARRLLAFEDGTLVGQVALEHRVIGTSTGPATIFGLIEVCVAVEARGRGIASEMLRSIERLAIEHTIDFLVLFATDRRLYERQGFQPASNRLRWLMINEHTSPGIDEQPLEELMVKPAGDRPWPDGPVDLLGYQF